MIETKTAYNETTDGFVPSPEGVYPCHVVAVDSREYNGNKVFNFQFRVADEVEKLPLPKLVSDGNGWYVNQTDENGNTVTQSGKAFAGRKFFSKGVWFTPEPVQEERWKNRTYKEFCENLGVVFRTEGDDIMLDEVEESDVVGKPCLAKVVMNEYENRDGETKRSMQVGSVTPWKDGVELSSDELDSDVPF